MLTCHGRFTHPPTHLHPDAITSGLTAGDGTHPDLAPCNPADKDQDFTFVQVLRLYEIMFLGDLHVRDRVAVH